MEQNLEKIIKDFIEGNYEEYPKEYSVAASAGLNDDDENKYIYNEFSFQHELGSFLREKLSGEGYKIKFEKNFKKIYKIGEKGHDKSECDILIMKGKEKYAIELKYLKNKAYPYRMYQCVQDMEFMYKAKEIEGMKATYCVVVTENTGFYEKQKDDNKLLGENEALYNMYKDKIENMKESEIKKLPIIYKYFRDSNGDWERGDYVVSNLKNGAEPINIKEFKDKIKFEWKSVTKKNEKVRYYILKF